MLNKRVPNQLVHIFHHQHHHLCPFSNSRASTPVLTIFIFFYTEIISFLFVVVVSSPSNWMGRGSITTTPTLETAAATSTTLCRVFFCPVCSFFFSRFGRERWKYNYYHHIAEPSSTVTKVVLSSGTGGRRIVPRAATLSGRAALRWKKKTCSLPSPLFYIYNDLAHSFSSLSLSMPWWTSSRSSRLDKKRVV